MSVPASYLTDPDLPQAPPSMAGLTLQEQRALGATAADPQATLRQYQDQNAQETAYIEQIELERMRAENAQMRDQLGSTAQQLQQVQSGYDNLSGQMSAWQQAQATQAAHQQSLDQFAFSPEEVENHGDLLPLVEKVAAKTRYEMEQEWTQRLANEKATWQAEATAPLQQELQQTRQQLESQAQRASADFASRMQEQVADLGLGSIDSVMKMPEFLRRFHEPVAPGVSVAWGDQLKKNIEDQNLYAVRAMLEDFRNNNTNFQQRTDVEVPTTAPVQRPLTGTQAANLEKREQMLSIYEQRQADANMGKFPVGWDRSKYRVEQEKLKAQIDLIPFN